jgi:hypothetical protein
VRSGFPSGIAQAKTKFQEKCAAVFHEDCAERPSGNEKSRAGCGAGFF